MAHTARNDEETKEYFDEPEVLEKKIKSMAAMIKKSKHFIVFTGAGISTGAGIPDFRSGKDTVLETGAGGWTRKAAVAKGEKFKEGTKRVAALSAIPTKAHMALVKLNQVGKLKWLISQNCDGLHRRSGFPAANLSELHGNTNLEKCIKCGKEYLRDFKTYLRRNGASHLTGRKCQCGGKLKDTGINFGDALPEKQLNDGFDNAEKADLCIVLGSSCTVTPAADMPEVVGDNKKADLVIVNLQSTPLDHCATMKVGAKIDDVMVGVMKELGLEIPEFRLKRRVLIHFHKSPNYRKHALQILGGDAFEPASVITDNPSISTDVTKLGSTPFTLFKSVTLNGPSVDEKQLEMEPMNFFLAGPQKQSLDRLKDAEVCLSFMGHYQEPDLKLKVGTLSAEFPTIRADCEFDPFNRSWTTAMYPLRAKIEIEENKEEEVEEVTTGCWPVSCAP